MGLYECVNCESREAVNGLIMDISEECGSLGLGWMFIFLGDLYRPPIISINCNPDMYPEVVGPP